MSAKSFRVCLASVSRRSVAEPDRPHRYTQKQLFDVVSDVSSYPKFLPFCSSSRVLTCPPRQMPDGRQILEAELTVGFMAFKESYVSTVTCTPNKSVEVSVRKIATLGNASCPRRPSHHLQPHSSKPYRRSGAFNRPPKHHRRRIPH